MKWTDAQLRKFELDPAINSASIYADQIMRPMAQEYCPLVLEAFDSENNMDENPLGPNWHAFAGELERATITAYQLGQSDTLISYFAFLNWSVNEATSYLPNESILTPLAGFTYAIPPTAWMKYFPIPNLDVVVQYARGYFKPRVLPPLVKELQKLKSDPVSHRASWQPLHVSFSKTADRLNIPYTNLLWLSD